MTPTSSRGTTPATPADEVAPWRFRSAGAALIRTVAADAARGPGARGDARWTPSPPRIQLRPPIFIVGAPRSGTTYLGDAVGRLASVAYHFEPVATKYAAQRFATGSWGSAQTAKYLRSAYWLLVASRLEWGRRLCDKTPQASFLVSVLAEHFPDSQFVHIVRDGRDAAVSYRERPWLRQDSSAVLRFEPGGGRWGPYPRFWTEADRQEEFRTTSDLHRCIWAWRRFTEAAAGQSAQLPEGRLLTVRYEHLVSDPHAVGQRLAEFLGEPRSATSLMNHLAATANPASVGRWRQLSRDEQSVLTDEAGTLLADLGYL